MDGWMDGVSQSVSQSVSHSFIHLFSITHYSIRYHQNIRFQSSNVVHQSAQQAFVQFGSNIAILCSIQFKYSTSLFNLVQIQQAFVQFSSYIAILCSIWFKYSKPLFNLVQIYLFLFEYCDTIGGLGVRVRDHGV